MGLSPTRVVLLCCLTVLASPVAVPYLLWLIWMTAWRLTLRSKWRRMAYSIRQNYDETLWSTMRSFGRLKISLRKNKLSKLRRKKREVHQSRLLELPLELKLQIWRLVYEDMTIHMASHGKSVRHFVCPEKPPLRPSWSLDTPRYVQCSCRGSALEPPFKNSPDAVEVKKRREKEPVTKGRLRVPGLYLTCREM